MVREERKWVLKRKYSKEFISSSFNRMYMYGGFLGRDSNFVNSIIIFG